MLPGITVAAPEAADSSLTDQQGKPATEAPATVEELRQRIRVLENSLGLANAEARLFRNQYTELRLSNEALGVDALTGDEQRLHEKLVQAVKEGYQAERKRRETVRVLDRLLAASTGLIATAKGLDPAKRAEFEVARRSAQGLLEGRGTGPVPIAYGLSDAQIVDINPGLAAVIINAGRAQGVREGMPFLVIRNEDVIGRVKVVMTREDVSAALVEQNVKDKEKQILQVGDRLKVDAN